MVTRLEFAKRVNEVVEPFLEQRGYHVRQEYVGLKSPHVPADFYQPYTRDLGALGYAHVVLIYTRLRREPYQVFEVLLLRHEGLEPWESWAMPGPGRPRSNIAGYLPIPAFDPLPLISDGSRERWSWAFRSGEELRSQLQVVQERLAIPVLPWLESPEATQVVQVDKQWYIEPLANYMSGVWDAATAFAAASRHEPPQYWLDAGSADDTFLVNSVVETLWQLQLPKPPDPPYREVLGYLMTCLEGREPFSRGKHAQLLGECRQRAAKG